MKRVSYFTQITIAGKPSYCQTTRLHCFFTGLNREGRSIEGAYNKVFDEESDDYFKTRPRESQISSWASDQSSIIPGRHYIEKQFESFKSIFAEKKVPRPEHWGGFRLIPTWFEFWQEREFRMHDRLTYVKRENRWVIERLAP
jgi:pyridoxamine 5'-phosphate oxidase